MGLPEPACPQNPANTKAEKARMEVEQGAGAGVNAVGHALYVQCCFRRLCLDSLF